MSPLTRGADIWKAGHLRLMMLKAPVDKVSSSCGDGPEAGAPNPSECSKFFIYHAEGKGGLRVPADGVA